MMLPSFVMPHLMSQYLHQFIRYAAPKVMRKELLLRFPQPEKNAFAWKDRLLPSMTEILSKGKFTDFA